MTNLCLDKIHYDDCFTYTSLHTVMHEGATFRPEFTMPAVWDRPSEIS